MDRTNAPGHVNHRFVAEDPITLAPPTELVPTDFNAWQEELVAIIEAAGIAPSAANNAQVIEALKVMFDSANLRLTKNVAGNVDVVLTVAEAQSGIINFVGALTGNINVIVPNSARRWIYTNNTTGAFSLTVKTAAGTGYAVPQGIPSTLFCDGTNVDLQNELGATAAQFDNSNRIATTEFVKRQGLNSAATVIVNATSALTAAHAGKTILCGSAAPITVTLPLLSTMQDGSQIQLDNTSFGLVTIARQGGDSIAGLNNIAATSYGLNSGDQITLVASPALGQWFLVVHSSIGVGQTWQDVTASRVAGTTYTNTTGRPIAVSLSISGAGATLNLVINGIGLLAGVGIITTAASCRSQLFAIIPPGGTYGATTTPDIWKELR